RYMEANLDRKINLNRVASHIGMNSKSLSWFCSHHLPGGFSAFLIAMRLDRAADLLLSTSDTVLYISLSCGFESISNFNKQFRKKFGMSPSNFRRK
ncbi:AraC family transcriptional regulator, partial [Bacteroidales bacterium OttesenSCG-928-A17]|nr:AraC family transcriptional regulator [Bacteroidales bacterium OttesenSCG-928-A17]